jgi:hypothetical protein
LELDAASDVFKHYNKVQQDLDMKDQVEHSPGFRHCSISERKSSWGQSERIRLKREVGEDRNRGLGKGQGKRWV